MNPIHFSGLKGPEEKILCDVANFLKIRDWFVMRTHGNMYQHGFPDLWVSHVKYGPRWVEIKNPLKYGFTPAQLENFPKICANGSGVWILVAPTEAEYNKLFKPCNWWHYLEHV